MISYIFIMTFVFGLMLPGSVQPLVVVHDNQSTVTDVQREFDVLFEELRTCEEQEWLLRTEQEIDASQKRKETLTTQLEVLGEQIAQQPKKQPVIPVSILVP